jgi:(4-O-methyl)-D-glucuronate---lignin esterase
MSKRRALLIAILCCATWAAAAQQPPAQAPSTNLGSDANGNPRRLAVKTGHVSNYDETKVRPYTLPDPLVLSSGKPVRDATTWQRERRPEIIRMYETEIFGRVPASAPKVTWTVTETDPAARGGTVAIKRIAGTMAAVERPRIALTLYTPPSAKGRVPIILLVNFGGGGGPAPAAALPSGEPPVAAEILARGWGYATIAYQDIQPDRADSLKEGVIALARAPGQAPAPDDWGAISAWAWGVSRTIDYLASDPSVDPKRIALEGHSRLGKTALWASANDDRIAAVFSSCAGEMGSALSRRDWGETVDDMTQNFPWWFSPSFQKWAGRWDDMPVDAHMLIALSAPRPVFVTGGTKDQWADPVGEYLAAVAAGPVYRLLGRKDLGSSQPQPPLDTPLTRGDIGWHYHSGGHAATPEDWGAFLVFLDKYFK